MVPQAVTGQRRSLKTMCFNVLLLLLLLAGNAVSQSIITSLPGFPGELPFKLETGYIGVGELEEIQLFYYFIESERDPTTDPLVFWMTGGPGCSGLSALLFEIGPLNLDVQNFNGSSPSLLLNPYSWTKVANIIFIDQPVGTGFSYATTSAAANSSDTKAVSDAHSFLRKWLILHPNFMGNPLYIGGDSYSGIVVPMLVLKIVDGNDKGLYPRMELQGYLLGNPVTNNTIDRLSRFPLARRLSLISDELYTQVIENCEGDYFDYMPRDNSTCYDALQSVKICLLQINTCMVLEPQCSFSSPRSKYETKRNPKAQQEETIQYFLSLGRLPPLRCRSFSYALSYMWANAKPVQEALHVRNGTIDNWMRCRKDFSTYTSDVTNAIPYQQNLTKTGTRALIYSGDHDMSVPYVGTLKWIRSLDVPVVVYWRPWYVDGQIAGYMQKFDNNQYRLTYATVKGAGHTAPEFKRKETLAMVDRWFAYYLI